MKLVEKQKLLAAVFSHRGGCIELSSAPATKQSQQMQVGF